MKRGGPLARRTELRRTGRLAPESPKRRAERPTRTEVRAQALARDGGCVARELVPEVRCWGPLDADERIPRSLYPGGHLDLDNVQILCRAHHDWKGLHFPEARELGLAGGASDREGRPR